MEVEFQRIGKCRYAVSVHRPGHIDLEMNPAPGYDDLLPHDLVHFVVERELGLQRGIFGQLAAGGTAGTFHPIPPASCSREWSRVSRELARRGAKLQREGRSDCELSERVAQVCLQAWRARAFVNRSQTAGLDAGVTQGQLDRVRNKLDELSAQWVRLQVGEALTVVWPECDRKLGRAREGINRIKRRVHLSSLVLSSYYLVTLV